MTEKSYEELGKKCEEIVRQVEEENIRENKKQLAKILEKHREERKRRKENEELFKQALIEGVSRRFQKIIDNYDK
jgi:hypothetical protein